MGNITIPAGDKPFLTNSETQAFQTYKNSGSIKPSDLGSLAGELYDVAHDSGSPINWTTASAIFNQEAAAEGNGASANALLGPLQQEWDSVIGGSNGLLQQNVNTTVAAACADPTKMPAAVKAVNELLQNEGISPNEEAASGVFRGAAVQTGAVDSSAVLGPLNSFEQAWNTAYPGTETPPGQTGTSASPSTVVSSSEEGG